MSGRGPPAIRGCRDPEVRFEFIAEPTPEEASGWLHPMQLYSHRVASGSGSGSAPAAPT